MYDVYKVLYSVHCTVNSVQYTQYCILYSVQCTVYTLYVYAIQCKIIVYCCTVHSLLQDFYPHKFG